MLWSKHRAVVSHDSAAAADALGVSNPARVHPGVPSEFRMADTVVVVHHRLLPETDLTVLDGASITSVPRTVLGIIESHIDEEPVESVVADALATGAVTKARLASRRRCRDRSRRAGNDGAGEARSPARLRRHTGRVPDVRTVRHERYQGHLIKIAP